MKEGLVAKPATPDAAVAPRPERGKTDKALRRERTNSDEFVASTRVAEMGADALVEHARQRADTVLETARELADDRINPAGQGGAVDRERALSDHVLKIERAAADEILRLEREEQARVAEALRKERRKTDRFLLTERARSDDALEHRDDVLGMVSHDLRNMLNGIGLQASVLLSKASDSEEGRRSVTAMEHVQRYVTRMNRLLGDLNDVASIDAGQLAVQRERGDAAALVSEAVAAYLQSATESGVLLVAETPARPVLANFDHDRLLQVLTNLISNSLKFTRPGGAIVVRTQRVGDELHFSVRDTGIGIPPDMLEAVFERFRQVEKNDPRGLGLGLHISKCIVEAHGGTIRVQSTLGDGCVFEVTVPQAKPRDA